MAGPSRILAAVVAATAVLVPTGDAAAATNGPIVFQGAGGRGSQLFTIGADGTGLKQITHIPATGPKDDPGGPGEPAWSPDGSTVAFNSVSGHGVNLFTVKANGSGLSELPLAVGEFNGDPAYSPDGTQISFDQDTGSVAPKVHGIFIVNADGTNAHRLTRSPATKEAFDTESQWSPDGTRIAFTRVKRIGRAAIFVIGVHGHGLKRLTPWKLDAATPDWSPDGRTIIFNTHFDPGPGQSANLYSMRPDGSGRRALTHHHRGRAHAFRPCWSPDGTKILFSRFKQGKGKSFTFELYTAKPDGTGVERLTNLPRKFPSNADWGTAP